MRIAVDLKRMWLVVESTSSHLLRLLLCFVSAMCHLAPALTLGETVYN